MLAACFAEPKPYMGSTRRVWNHTGKLCGYKDGIIERMLD